MNIYRYTNYDNGGIVIAENKDEAKRFLCDRYGDEDFIVWEARYDDFYDPSCPNVYECY